MPTKTTYMDHTCYVQRILLSKNIANGAVRKSNC